MGKSGSEVNCHTFQNIYFGGQFLGWRVDKSMGIAILQNVSFEASHGQLKGVWKGIGVAIGKGDLLTPSVNFAIKKDLRAEM